MDDASLWYATLLKPAWAPPSWVFGPVWTVLYIIIALSFFTVFRHIWERKIPWTHGIPFVLNLITNFLFTPLQFGLENNILALIDILLVLGSLIWATIIIYPSIRWVAYAQVPYLLWVSFATVLQVTITILNW